MESVRIDVWSDIACPWCWIGKHHLEAALERIERPVEVRWRAFELNPSAPKVAVPGRDTIQRLADKYRTTRSHAQQMVDRMTEAGARAGVDMRLDRLQPSNTFDAHRLLHWAAGRGRQGALKERLFSAYLHQGQSVSDHSTLVMLATEVGLDSERAQSVLSSDEYAQAVREEQAHAGRLGVTGVPFFLTHGRLAVAGAQPADVLLDAIQQAGRDAPPPSSSPNPDAEVCGPDGCPVPTPS